MRSRFELATLVESHRRRMGLTQADLAARVGVSRQWINSLEAAESNPSFSNLVAVLQVLGVCSWRSGRPSRPTRGPRRRGRT